MPCARFLALVESKISNRGQAPEIYWRATSEAPCWSIARMETNEKKNVSLPQPATQKAQRDIIDLKF